MRDWRLVLILWGLALLGVLLRVVVQLRWGERLEQRFGDRYVNARRTWSMVTLGGLIVFTVLPLVALAVAVVKWAWRSAFGG